MADTGDAQGEWMPLKEAAAALGVTYEAVRQRVKRRTLRSRKGHNDGRAWVWISAAELAKQGDTQGDRTQGARTPAPTDTTGTQGQLALVVALYARLAEVSAERDHDRATLAGFMEVLSATLERVAQDEAARREEVARALEDRDRAREDADEARAELREALDALGRRRAEVGLMFDDMKRQLDAMRRDREAEMDEHARLRAAVERLRRPWWKWGRK